MKKKKCTRTVACIHTCANPVIRKLSAHMSTAPPLNFSPKPSWFPQELLLNNALQQIVDTWIQSLDDGKIGSVLFLDLSAGFDVINHNLLLKKLERYKFTTNTLNWFRSYMTERYQAVQV